MEVYTGGEGNWKYQTTQDVTVGDYYYNSTKTVRIRIISQGGGGTSTSVTVLAKE